MDYLSSLSRSALLAISLVVPVSALAQETPDAGVGDADVTPSDAATGTTPTDASSGLAVTQPLEPIAAVAPAPAVAQPVPVTSSSSGLVLEMATIESLHQRGILSDAAYESAMRDLSDTVGAQGADSNTLVLGRWTTTLYGFVEADMILDSTQSFNDAAGNALVARPGAYAGDHLRTTFGVRNSRIGFRLAAPEFAGIRASAVLEMDFLGNQPTTASEAATITSPTFRVRHFNLKLETEIVDVLIGQSWQLFGWQSTYHPNTVDIQGVPAQLYSRTPQIRLSHRFHTDAVDVELALAAMRPPQRDSATPEGQAGVRLAVNHWKGIVTNGSTGTSVAPFSFAVTGDVRRYSLKEFTAAPVHGVDVLGWGVAGDLFVPILPAENVHTGNALSLTGEVAYGVGTADLYSGLNGGVSFAALPNPMMLMPAPTYTPNIDPGLVVYTADGVAHAVQWTSLMAGLQYYLPACDGRVWVSVNYGRLMSDNAAQLGAANAVRVAEDWADVNLFADITPAVRLGLEYALFADHYADHVDALNHRAQLSAFYRF